MHYKRVVLLLLLVASYAAFIFSIPANAADPVNDLMIAAAIGDVGKVKTIIARGVDVNAKSSDGQTALLLASTNGHTKVVAYLLSKGADPSIKDRKGLTALSVALKGGHAEVVKLLKLRPQKAAVKAEKPTSTKAAYLSVHLINAATKGNAAEVKKLLNAGADIETKDKNVGGTPLVWAAFLGHKDVVKLLLEKGADVHARNKKKWSPLLLACAKQHTSIAELLLEKGADLDARTPDGWTAVSIAYAKRRPQLISLLERYIAKAPWGEAAVARVDKPGNCLRVRKHPSNSSKKVGCVKRGKKIKLSGVWTDTNWAQICDPVTGWVRATQIDTKALPSKKRAVIGLGKAERPKRPSSRQRYHKRVRSKSRKAADDMSFPPLGPSRKHIWH